jgi:hypothetical protein
MACVGPARSRHHAQPYNLFPRTARLGQALAAKKISPIITTGVSDKKRHQKKLRRSAAQGKDRGSGIRGVGDDVATGGVHRASLCSPVQGIATGQCEDRRDHDTRVMGPPNDETRTISMTEAAELNAVPVWRQSSAASVRSFPAERRISEQTVFMGVRGGTRRSGGAHPANPRGGGARDGR